MRSTAPPGACASAHAPGVKCPLTTARRYSTSAEGVWFELELGGELGWWMGLVDGVGGWGWRMGLADGVGGWGWRMGLADGVGGWGWRMGLADGPCDGEEAAPSYAGRTYVRLTPVGQITLTVFPYALAYATTSTVPPSPRAGLPSQIATHLSQQSTTR